MKRRVITLAIIVALIYISFIIAIGLSLRGYYKREIRREIERNITSTNLRNSNQLTNRLNEDYEAFKVFIDNHTNDELNLNKPCVYNQSYLGFGIVEEDGYVFEDGTKKNFLLNINLEQFRQDISIFSFNLVFQNETEKESYIFFVYNDRFGYFLADEYVSAVVIADSFMLASNAGLVLFNGVENNTATNLSGYFQDSSRVVQKLRSDENGVMEETNQDGRIVTIYCKTDAIDNLYLLEYMSYDEYIVRIHKLINPIHAIMIIITVALLILSIFYGSVFSSIYRDVELSLHQFNYNNIPIIKINRKGRIIYRNKQFKKEFFDFSNNKYITEIFLVDLLDIYKQIPLKAWLVITTGPYNSAVLNVIKTSVRGYTILIYPSMGTQSFDSTILVNTHTDIANLNQYKLDFHDLNKSFLSSQKNQAVVCIRIINLRNVELMRGQAYLEEAIFKAAHKLRGLALMTSGVKFYHSFDNTFVLLYESKDLTTVKEDVIRIIKKFEEEKLDYEYDINFYLRAGIYNFDARTERSGAIFVYEKAKIACDTLRSTAGSLIGVYDTVSDVKIQQNYLIAHDLEAAIDTKELYMALQPIYNLEEKRVTGFEALLRWNNEKYKKVLPPTIIEVAQQSNLISKLGNYIIDESLARLKELEAHDVSISINIDPLQLLQVGFVDFLKTLIGKHQINPHKIVFEITETNLIIFFDDIVKKINELRNLGIKVYIDDFGTGNSSLLYLKELPVDGLKIDREFVKDLEIDRYLRATITMIVGLAKTLNIDVVAEGVEALEQMEFLTKREVKYIQGFLIGKPIPINEVLRDFDSLNKKL